MVRVTLQDVSPSAIAAHVTMAVARVTMILWICCLVIVSVVKKSYKSLTKVLQKSYKSLTEVLLNFEIWCKDTMKKLPFANFSSKKIQKNAFFTDSQIHASVSVEKISIII